MRKTWTIPAIGLFLAICHLAAQQWPQWRGPNRDGVVKFTGPKVWPEKLTTRWKVEVGRGYASPLLAGGRIYQFARQGDEEVAMSLDAATGKVLWKQGYAAPYEPVASAARHGLGPKSTPLYFNGRFYTFGISGILSAFDADGGKLSWQKNYAKDFKATWPQFGTSMSPAAADGLVVVLIGTNDDGAIAAYDAATGAQKWIWKGDGPAYSSPLIAEVGGVKQVMSLTQGAIVGLGLLSGELLWKIDFPEKSGMNIPSPLLVDGRLIVASTAGTYALEPARSGAAWTAKTVWHNPELSMRFSSPVRKGNLLFGFSSRNTGMFFCADAVSGKTLWTSEPRQGDNAKVFLAGEQLLLLKNDATLIVAAATDKAFEPLKRYQVAESNTYADPLFFDQGILIKDETSLALLTWQ